jgi:hypothetical protein
VAQHPLEWAYTTVAQSSRAWGFRFEFVKPPEAVETFRLEGTRLLGDGAGTVSVRTPGGVVFSAKLPFNVAVPSAPRNRLRDQRLQRRRGRR